MWRRGNAVPHDESRRDMANETEQTVASDLMDRLLDRFEKARSEPRRFHAMTLGRGVNPNHCFGDWLSLVRRNDEPTLYKRYGSILSSKCKASLGVNTGGVGGYLLPTEFRYDMIIDAAEDAVIRPRATVIPMTTGIMQLPYPDITTSQTAGTPPFFGGMLFKWVHAKDAGETEPQFRLLELRAWDLDGYLLASNPMLLDGARPLEFTLRQLVARSIGWFEELAFLLGTGVGQPLGAAVGPWVLTQARNAATDFQISDASGMFDQLLPYSVKRAVWIISPTVAQALVKVGQAGFGSSWNPNVPTNPRDEGAIGYLFSRPVFISSVLPALGTRADVVLVDPSLYVIGDREAIEISVSEHEPTAYLKNQSVWRVIHRVDGQPLYSQPVTLPDATTKVSSCIVLV